MTEISHSDLSQCDREPIHIPGSIQPHGVLLVLQEPELTIVQVSDNAENLLKIPIKDLLLSRLSSFLANESLQTFSVENLSTELLNSFNPVTLTTSFRGQQLRWDAVLHRSQGLLLLELERTAERKADFISSFVEEAHAAVSRLQGPAKLSDLMKLAALEVRKICGFDRVMIYRFDEDGHGKVIAESKAEEVESFLGLHFPASDIPKQARVLYEKNWLRLIPNANYRPSLLLPEENELLNAPLDLSFSILRSISPIHCEYLKNMGVTASMSISLMKDGILWGLISCHHQTERFVSFEARSVCEFLGQTLSWQISTKAEAEQKEQNERIKEVEVQLIKAMETEMSFARALLKNEASLLELVHAQGAAASYEDELCLMGKTPSREQIKRLIAWLKKREEGQVFHSNCLSQSYPESETFKDVASGLLSVSVSKENNSFLLWFRPELIETVQWAGDPNKSLEVDSTTNRLNPRKSFALWKETLRLHSLPWIRSELSQARDLRGIILGVIIKKASEIRQRNFELTKAVQSRDDFLSIASHEIKAPISLFQLQLQTMLKTAKKTEGDLPRQGIVPKLEIAKDHASRLKKLIDNLFDVSRISSGQLTLEPQQGVNLSDLISVTAEVHKFAFKKLNRELNLHVQSDVTGCWDPLRLGQIVTNLLTNALKYGGKQPVDVELWADDKKAIIRVKDRGLGIPSEKLSVIFDQFERATSDHQSESFGLGLWIVRQILEEMNGKITVESEMGKGSVFIVELPRM